MVSLLRKLVPPSEYRKLLGAVVVIEANVGGAWTPIDDVTTTMLWIHGQISTLPTMTGLFACLVQFLLQCLWPSCPSQEKLMARDRTQLMFWLLKKMAPRGQLVFALGIRALVFVPVFKSLTGLPSYLGILFGLEVLWILTDVIHYGESDIQWLKVP
ncbi:hypothetical protein Hdeb2414_s0019g00547831 [Helianthus debilis subsp. tardiflorus]